MSRFMDLERAARFGSHKLGAIAQNGALTKAGNPDEESNRFLISPEVNTHRLLTAALSDGAVGVIGGVSTGGSYSTPLYVDLVTVDATFDVAFIAEVTDMTLDGTSVNVWAAASDNIYELTPDTDPITWNGTNGVTTDSLVAYSGNAAMNTILDAASATISMGLVAKVGALPDENKVIYHGGNSTLLRLGFNELVPNVSVSLGGTDTGLNSSLGAVEEGDLVTLFASIRSEDEVELWVNGQAAGKLDISLIDAIGAIHSSSLQMNGSGTVHAMFYGATDLDLATVQSLHAELMTESDLTITINPDDLSDLTAFNEFGDDTAPYFELSTDWANSGTYSIKTIETNNDREIITWAGTAFTDGSVESVMYLDGAGNQIGLVLRHQGVGTAEAGGPYYAFRVNESTAGIYYFAGDGTGTTLVGSTDAEHIMTLETAARYRFTATDDEDDVDLLVEKHNGSGWDTILTHTDSGVDKITDAGEAGLVQQSTSSGGYFDDIVITVGEGSIVETTYAGNCLELSNGSYLYEAVASDAIIRGGSYSMQAWVNFTTLPATATAEVVGFYGSDANAYFGIEVTSAGDVVASVPVQTTTGQSLKNVAAGVTLITGTWYHIVTVWDTDDNSLKIYINDTEEANTTVSLDADTSWGWWSGTQEFRIGGGNIAVVVDVDAVALFDTALSAEDVTALYAEGIGDWYGNLTEGISDNTLRWYDLEEPATVGPVNAVDRSQLLIKNLSSGITQTIGVSKGDTQIENITGSASESPIKGTAVVLDGTGDYYVATTALPKPIKDGLTLAAWIRPTAQPGATIPFLSITGGSSPNTQGPFIAVDDQGSGVKFQANMAYFDAADKFDEQVEIEESSPTEYALDVWYHVVFTYNDFSKIGRVYVNGALLFQDTMDSETRTGTAGAYSDAVVSIGGHPELAASFTGEVDFAATWDRDLDANEVSRLYNRGRFYDMNSVGFENSLIEGMTSWYDFNSMSTDDATKFADQARERFKITLRNNQYQLNPRFMIGR